MPLVYALSCLIFIVVGAESARLNSSAKSGMDADFFTNPILEEISADPMVLKVGDFYYMVVTKDYFTERDLTIMKSPVLTDFRNAERKQIYVMPEGFQDLWAPEMHLIDGGLYIYFAMAISGRGHRSYVLRADDAADPMGSWNPYAVRTLPGVEATAIDATILKYPDGRLFYIWCRDGTLLIAPMNNPEEVGHPRNVLKTPQQAEGLNEGAFIIYRGSRIFLVFSSWRNGYCLQIMGMDDYETKDPLDPFNWWTGSTDCIFQSDFSEDVVNPGHASFTTSPDGTETWMIYHGQHADSAAEGWFKDRFARAQKLEWSESNYPIFPRPLGDGRQLEVPSGQLLH